MPATLRIVLADDHQLVRQTLCRILQGQPDLQVVGQAADSQGVVAMVKALKPDLVLMDVSMPEEGGVMATEQVKALDPDVVVVALTLHHDSKTAKAMLAAGASAFLLKDCPTEELLQTLRRVAAGLPAGGSGGGEKARARSNRVKVADPAASPQQRLTPRQLEVLCLLAQGQNSHEIASALSMSVKTVETHRQQITRNLGLRGVAQLTRYALREGLVQLD